MGEAILEGYASGFKPKAVSCRYGRLTSLHVVMASRTRREAMKMHEGDY